MINEIPNLGSIAPESWKYIMQPETIRAGNETITSTLSSYAILIVVVLMIVGFWSLISWLVSSEKTRSYRKEIKDMYVAGSIRKFAEEDNIDLDEEYKKFKKWEKKKTFSDKELDSVVEANLKEKLSEKSDKEIDRLV